MYASATIEDESGDVIVKVVNASAKACTTRLELEGTKGIAGAAWTLLASASLTDENTVASPDRVVPEARSVSPEGGKLSLDLPAGSFSVIRVRVAR